MTTEVAKHGRAGRAPRRRRLVAVAASPVAVCLGAALVAGGGTYALWADDGSFTGGTVSAGDLSMTVGAPTWAQVTPGDDTLGSGQLLTTPAGFYSMPGDVVKIRVPVTTTLVGDNLNAGVEVSFANPQAVSADIAAGLISAGYHIENAAGVQVAPVTGQAALGSTVVVSDIVGDNDGQTDNWTVVVTVNVLGDYQWLTDDLDGYPGDWAAGDLLVRLVQVRTGTGYTTAGGTQ